MIPYAEVTEATDRRWTTRLLGRLNAPGLSADELGDLVRALQAASDPRSFRPLEAVVCDPTKPARVREAAGAASRGMHHIALDVPDGTLRRWWRKGDLVLRRHALLLMSGIRCPDIIEEVAADSTHPFQSDALGRMDFWFDRPRHQAVKVAGLGHHDHRVRATAAWVLLWDEPVAAEGPLVEATRDPFPGVAAEAANTLEYYPTLRVIRRLHELLHHTDNRVCEEAEESFQSIRCELLSRLCGKDRQVADHVRRWLQPTWDLLEFTDQDLRYDDEGTSARPEPPVETTPLGDLLALLADPDASPLVLGNHLRSIHWSAYTETEHRRLRKVLPSHPDQLVREQATGAFADWGDLGGLMELVRDADFCVRKAAMYWLGRLPPSPSVADLAWDHLHKSDTLGVHATETLGTFVSHASPADAVGRLEWIAGDHGYSEGLRVAAVGHMASLGAAGEVRQLAGLLLEPPAVTWALHVRHLEALADLGHPAGYLGDLRAVDNLHVQVAVARADAGA